MTTVKDTQVKSKDMYRHLRSVNSLPAAGHITKLIQKPFFRGSVVNMLPAGPDQVLRRGERGHLRLRGVARVAPRQLRGVHGQRGGRGPGRNSIHIRQSATYYLVQFFIALQLFVGYTAYQIYVHRI